MAKPSRYVTTERSNLEWMVKAAKRRRLSTSEICVILRHYTEFKLAPDPPFMPPAGSLFLFDQRVQPYFRNDGYRWRTQTDGKTIEVYEKLKVGGEHVLQGYYARGWDNMNLQRRCYWMLGQLEHIVLVHYWNEKEDNKSGISCLRNADSDSQLRSPQSYSAPNYSLEFKTPTSDASNPTKFPRHFGSEFPQGSFNSVNNLPKWDWVDGQGSSSESKLYSEQPSTAHDRLSNKLICPRLDGGNSAQDTSLSGLMLDYSQTVVQPYDTSLGKIQHFTEVSMLKKNDNRELTKLDSSERPMDMNIEDYNDTLIASDFGEYGDLLNDEVLHKEVPSLSHHMLLDTNSVDASLSQENLFSTSAYSGDECFLIRLTKLLCSGIEKAWLGCSIVNCENCKLNNLLTSLKDESESSWRMMEAAHNSRDLLIQKLLKDKLYDWLICKKHEINKGPHTLDDEGLGIIHLAAALNYEWAIHPMVVSGVSVNSRDLKGRTALHWASLYGREEAVVVLLSLGAASGAVDDPTPINPGGQTAADLASSGGHKGIAGYLAEADLTSRLQALSINENVSTIAKSEAERATKDALQNVCLRSERELDEGSSLSTSVAAFGRSAYAAACIEAIQKDAGVRKTLARVLSMVHDPEARYQYIWLAAKFELMKEQLKGTSQKFEG